MPSIVQVVATLVAGVMLPNTAAEQRAPCRQAAITSLVAIARLATPELADAALVERVCSSLLLLSCARPLQMFEALFSGIQDYSVDSRGDVGSGYVHAL